MKKITILALHLNFGGVEKAITSLANEMCEEYDIDIISTYKIAEHPAFDLNKKIKVTYLIDDKPNKKEISDSFKKFKPFRFIKEMSKGLKLLFLKKHLMIKAIRKLDSDIIISTRDIHNLWLGKYGNKKSLKIGWEHNHHNNNQKYIDKIVKSVNKLDYLVLVSESLRDFYEKKMNKTNCKCIYIPNSINKRSETKSLLKNKQLVSVGRLSKEKGYLDLIDIFNIIHQEKPDWKLNIIGDGPEYENISNHIKQLNLEDSIIMHGFKSPVKRDQIVSNSSVYLMPSFTESFGIVLLEAFIYGIPAIAFDSAIGATELIDQNKNGYLISNRNKEEFAKKVLGLIDDKKKRHELGNNAYDSVVPYEVSEVNKRWNSLFKMKKNQNIKKVLFIASTGGHLNELFQLSPLFSEYNYHLITEKTKSTISLKDKYHDDIDYLVYGSKDHLFSYLFKFAYNILKSGYLFFKIRPNVIITTGTHTAVPICYIGKLFRRKVIFIETFANSTTKTLSGRLIYPIADEFIVQWESMLELYPKATYGGWIY